MAVPARELAGAPALDDLTPRQIVAELDKFIVGQAQAKRAVAIALRNRWRRQQLDPVLAEEVLPKNILMMGPTGVGKTEIARRLARLAKAPFLKVEASKFTEVGYVGRDVDSIVRDLAQIAVEMVKAERREEVREVAAQRAEERLLRLLVPPGPAAAAEPEDAAAATREKFRERLRTGALDSREVEIEIEEASAPSFEMFTAQGVEEVGLNLQEMMPGLFGRRRRRRVQVAEAREILAREEADKLIDRDQLHRDARHRVEQSGIVFLDEIDKIAGPDRGQGPDVSREGVQRDLLPIIEGSTVATRYGPVRTDHVLFIAAGAFHVSKPADLIPELQGRLPIRVQLDALGEEDFVRILTEPENALTRQYAALLSTEGLEISFTNDAVRELARMAEEVNRATENIGARRLATLMERLLDEVSFEAPDMRGVSLTIDAAYVRRSLADIVEDRNLSRYVL
ncbi:MAG: ATP-dependent protease ATPase subunit HslU [Thermoanaerobaculia bacterium]